MKTTERQRALYAEFFSPRTGGGKTFTLEDLLTQLGKAERLGLDDRQLADAWGTPVEFVRSLRATLET